MSEHEEAALLRLAESVADGKPVDWEAASLSGEASLQRIKRLQILASIASACGMPPAPPAVALKGDVLFHWGHLEVRAKIGEGVFGDVYRAWETTLEREVAVKFLRAGATPDAAHILQEGRNLAKIRHPGVVTVYGAEQLDGRVGIWMEYVRGRTLEDILQEEGPLTASEALRIGIDLCRALAAVHGAGLVHRDIKARNVVRQDDGRIVLMDFGTGIEAKPKTDTTPAFAGTPVYLAPEILRGESASPQSDVYGLGVLLYRLVTRAYPIVGTDLDALRSAHARGETRPLHDLRADLPAPFVHVVKTALAADPRQRFASAARMERALVAALDAPRAAAKRRAHFVRLAAVAVLGVCIAIAVHRWANRPQVPAANRNCIVVTDFVNETQDEELDGLASMLITSLEQSRAISVLTRSRMNDYLKSAGKLQSDRIDAERGREICRRAGAGVLVLPSIRQLGDGYRLQLDAIEPRRNRRLFSAEDAAPGKNDVPARIDALAERVRIAMKEEPSAIRATGRSVAQITTGSVRAYRHYERAEAHIDRLEMQEARTELETAVALDSSFGLAHGRLAYVYWWQNDAAGESRQLAKAIRLIDRIPERQRYLLRAQSAMADRQGLEAARAILLEMERFYPDEKEMLYDIGDYSSHLNEFPTAIQYLEKVIAMDADFIRALQHLARVYRDMGRRDLFLAWARRYAAADSSWDAVNLLGTAQVAAGDAATGIETLIRGGRLASVRRDELAMSLADAYVFQGRTMQAGAVWDRLIGGPAPAPALFVYQERADGAAHRGAYREALADLDRAIETARRQPNPVEEAMAQISAAYVWMLGRNDARTALERMRQCATLAGSITYRDTYFNYWVYWGGLFKLQLLNGDLAAAEAIAKQKFAADKWYGPYVAAYLHAARGECAPAQAAASRILEWGPAEENIEMLYFLARCHRDHGQLDQAAEFSQRLQSLYSNLTLGTPYYAKSMLLLGEIQQQRGDKRLAAASYEKLIDLWRAADADTPDLLTARARLQELTR